MKYKKQLKVLFPFLFCFFVFLFLKQIHKNNRVTELSFHRSHDGFILVDCIIQQKLYSLNLNLGRQPIFLQKELLEKIKKKEANKVQWRKLDGESLYIPSYIIPKITFNKNLQWENVTAIEKEEEENTYVRKEKKERICGEIGKEFLEKTNLFFNLPNNTIYACNNLKTLQKKGLIDNKLLKIPLNVDKNIMWLDVDSDFGSLKLVFSSGATRFALSASHQKGFSIDTKQLIVGNKDFGKTTFFSLDFDHNVIPFDGFIGLDFFEKHSIYIDYKNKFLYIGDSVNKNI